MKTMVLGASPKPFRYSHQATLRLLDHGHEVIPIGIHSGVIGGTPIVNLYNKPAFENLHTITMYLNQYHQKQWYQYLLALQPKRVIFNPGSENSEFVELLVKAGIYFEEACTLVMLATGNYSSEKAIKRNR